ncbi:hypothetical protein VMCG_04864 [Cytospora schulzeri]|uniref:MARVEL domain-containing protein n=1 Tax=Cytospora schulzeri TaxID=448051 RepID=A0A423WNB7_9PEZI|nr:hypothetical protein VMCG_04864 [Valsa malicola]
MAFIFTIGFIFWRFLEILTLIPTMGMLAYFVNGYATHNLLTPDYILILFIVSVLALAWAIATLFSYHRSSSNAAFVAIIDLGFVGAFIASVYYLRWIGGANCTNISAGDQYDVDLGVFGSFYGNGISVSTDKTCAMLKACFAFGIMNCIFFFFTSVLAWFHGNRRPAGSGGKDARYYRETHYSRRGHRRRSSSSRHGGGSRRGSTSHSHRRVYV